MGLDLFRCSLQSVYHDICSEDDGDDGASVEVDVHEP